jgi:hypothetical protein
VLVGLGPSGPTDELTWLSPHLMSKSQYEDAGIFWDVMTRSLTDK